MRFMRRFLQHHFMDQSDLAWLEQFSDLALSAEDQKALAYVHKTGRVDNAAYRSLNHTDTLTASRALTRLEGIGLLKRSDQRRGPGVYYTLAGEMEGTPQVTPQSTTELLRLSRARKRLSRDQVTSLLVTLCAERPRTARELAEIINRNVNYVRNSYLSPLVREGRLQLTGPPNDPNVAYRAARMLETE